MPHLSLRQNELRHAQIIVMQTFTLSLRISSNAASSSPAALSPFIIGYHARRGEETTEGWHILRPINSSAPCNENRSTNGIVIKNGNNHHINWFKILFSIPKVYSSASNLDFFHNTHYPSQIFNTFYIFSPFYFY